MVRDAVRDAARDVLAADVQALIRAAIRDELGARPAVEHEHGDPPGLVAPDAAAYCVQCKKPLPPGSTKRRKFCSDLCRVTWHREHAEK